MMARALEGSHFAACTIFDYLTEATAVKLSLTCRSWYETSCGRGARGEWFQRWWMKRTVLMGSGTWYWWSTFDEYYSRLLMDKKKAKEEEERKLDSMSWFELYNYARRQMREVRSACECEIGELKVGETEKWMRIDDKDLRDAFECHQHTWVEWMEGRQDQQSDNYPIDIAIYRRHRVVGKDASGAERTDPVSQPTKTSDSTLTADADGVGGGSQTSSVDPLFGDDGKFDGTAWDQLAKQVAEFGPEDVYNDNAFELPHTALYRKVKLTDLFRSDVSFPIIRKSLGLSSSRWKSRIFRIFAMEVLRSRGMDQFVTQPPSPQHRSAANASADQPIATAAADSKDVEGAAVVERGAAGEACSDGSAVVGVMGSDRRARCFLKHLSFAFSFDEDYFDLDDGNVEILGITKEDVENIPPELLAMPKEWWEQQGKADSHIEGEEEEEEEEEPELVEDEEDENIEDLEKIEKQTRVESWQLMEMYEVPKEQVSKGGRTDRLLTAALTRGNAQPDNSTSGGESSGGSSSSASSSCRKDKVQSNMASATSGQEEKTDGAGGEGGVEEASDDEDGDSSSDDEEDDDEEIEVSRNPRIFGKRLIRRIGRIEFGVPTLLPPQLRLAGDVAKLSSLRRLGQAVLRNKNFFPYPDGTVYEIGLSCCDRQPNKALASNDHEHNCHVLYVGPEAALLVRFHSDRC